MAELRFTAGGGAIESVISAPDGRAADIVDDYLAFHGNVDPDSMTQQEKADALMDGVRRHILGAHRKQVRDEAAASASVLDFD